MTIEKMKENQTKLIGRKGRIIKEVSSIVPVGIECEVVGYDKSNVDLIVQIKDERGWKFMLSNMVFKEGFRLKKGYTLLYALETEIEFY